MAPPRHRKLCWSISFWDPLAVANTTWSFLFCVGFFFYFFVFSFMRSSMYPFICPSFLLLSFFPSVLPPNLPALLSFFLPASSPFFLPSCLPSIPPFIFWPSCLTSSLPFLLSLRSFFLLLSVAVQDTVFVFDSVSFSLSIGLSPSLSLCLSPWSCDSVSVSALSLPFLSPLLSVPVSLNVYHICRTPIWPQILVSEQPKYNHSRSFDVLVWREGLLERWRTTSERSGDVAECRGSAPGAFQNTLKTLPSVPRSSKSCREIAEESFCTKFYYLIYFRHFSLLHKNIRWLWRFSSKIGSKTILWTSWGAINWQERCNACFWTWKNAPGAAQGTFESSEKAPRGA